MTVDSETSPASRRKRIIGACVAAAVLLGAGAAAWAVIGGDEEPGPTAFAVDPCWGLLEKADLMPILAAGKEVKGDSTDLDKSVKERRASFCSVYQRSGGSLRGTVQWRPQNPHNNPNSVYAWEPLVDGSTPVAKDWGAGAESWAWGTRVAVECRTTPPPGATEDFTREKYLDIRLSGKPAEGVGDEASEKVFADMTLDLARGIADKAGCTNDVNLP
ncbi:hypothetical protein [Streptomyces sp. SYSU K21746]